jgi:hypothetical protein
MSRFISEDATNTFEGWLEYQDFGSITPDQETILRKHYEEMKNRAPRRSV